MATLPITIYSLSQYDPTHTISLRNAFVREMTHKFSALTSLINRAIIEEDCFALQKGSGGFKLAGYATMHTPGRHAFDFPRTGDKVAAFMRWLGKQEDAGVLEVTHALQPGEAVEQAWTNRYILSAYQKGIAKARKALNKKSKGKIPTVEASGGIDAVFNSIPIHADRLGLLFTRVFSDLQGITNAMDSQIGRILATAMAEGKGPREIATLLVKTIKGPSGGLGITDKLGRFIPAKRRAEMLARTEIIRAHHQATIQEYRNWGEEGVVVKAEWQTTEDGRVCSECAALNGKIFELDVIEGMIPYHPNCRCLALPLDVTEEKRSKRK